MAVNPQQILNQQVPAAQQPTAQQTPISAAPQTLSAAQHPGAAQAPATQLPGGQQQPASLGDLPVLQPYNSQLQYLASLETTPLLQLPQVDDATLQAIQQKLLAEQKSNVLLSGQQLPNPHSKLAKTQSPMNPFQFIESVGQNFWQQEIVQPVQDYIQTWQNNPGQALLETLGGVAVTGGLIALEAATGGAATPFIFAGLAAMQAPNLINAWSREVTNPTDANLVQAVVSSGAAALAVGSPIKAFRGIKTARNLLENQVYQRKNAVELDKIADLLVGNREEVAQKLRTGAGLKQLETLDINDTDTLRDQLERRNVNLEEGPSADLLRHSEALAPIRKAIQDAKAAGDEEGRLSAVREMTQYARENIRDPMLSTAYHYLMLPSTPYAHVPLGSIQGVDEALQGVLNKQTNYVHGLLRSMHNGIGLQSPFEATHNFIASVKEAQGYEVAAGGSGFAASKIMEAWNEMKKAAGITDSDHVEKLLQALEEPEKWNALSSSEQAIAQKMRDISDMQTVGELKFGTIAQALQGRIAHFFTGPGEPSGEIKSTADLPSLYRNIGSRSRFWKAAVDDNENLYFRGKTRSEILADTAAQTKRAEKREKFSNVYGPNQKDIEHWRRSWAQHSKRYKNQAEAARVLDEARQRLGDVADEMIQMKWSKLQSLLRAKAPERKLVTGEEAWRRMLAGHVFRMQQARYGEALWARANMNLSGLKDAFPKLALKNWGASMELPQFKQLHDYPDILPETVFGGNTSTAESMDYFLAHPAVGRPTDLNYRPALYARGKLANEVTIAVNKLNSAEMQNAFMNALYNVQSLSKRWIMYNPLYHGLNMAGRAIAYALDNPSVAGSSFKAMQRLMEDPAAYYDTIQEASMNGMVHATRWNVSDKLRRMQREEDGQHSFPGALRTIGGAIDNFHKDTAEHLLWSTVDHLQMAGYLAAKQRFLDRGHGEFDAGRMAAVYANNLGGMVNPMYMSRLWQQLKGMVFFAPSYWSTFLHSLQSVVPGSSRISQVLNERWGGRLSGLATSPLRTIDRRARIELVRAHRDWMITYLAATAVSMDMMNVMFSGHHMWDNEEGRKWDIDVSNLPGLGGTQTTPSGEVRRAYMSSMPFFRQGVDLGNAFGIGHDWGFGHMFGDQAWQHLNAFQKASYAAGAMIDGTRRAGSVTIGQVPQVGYQAVIGEQLSARLGQGTQVKVPGIAALANLFPFGYQSQRLLNEYQQAGQQYKPGTPQYQQAQQQFQQQLHSLLPNLVLNGVFGMPSVYHMGVEKPLVDDSKYENWVTQRNASHDRLTQYSNQVFKGQMTPIEYSRHKHEETIRINQLNADTWGVSNPQAQSLEASYGSLSQRFGLDQSGLSDQDWFERYDLFQNAWEQQLQAASPSVRAAWWDHHTALWTDADYLEAEARELKGALAASIDGQGGNYIRAYQNQLFRLKPTMTIAEYQEAEHADPVYSTYVTLLAEMGRTSALGAFVGAFSSPFSQTYITPSGLSVDEAQALAAHTGQVVVRPEEAQALATQARKAAKEPVVGEAGGKFAASPEGQQAEQEAITAAQQGAANQ